MPAPTASVSVVSAVAVSRVPTGAVTVRGVSLSRSAMRYGCVVNTDVAGTVTMSTRAMQMEAARVVAMIARTVVTVSAHCA